MTTKNLGYAYLMKGDIERGLDCLQKALAVYQKEGMVDKVRKLEDFLKSLVESVEKKPGSGKKKTDK